MMLPASALPASGAETVYKRLWVHEVFRVFYDRLVDDNDRLRSVQLIALLHDTDVMLAFVRFSSHSMPLMNGMQKQHIPATAQF